MDTKILPEDLFGTSSSSNKGEKGQKSKSTPKSKKKSTSSGASRKVSKAKSSASAKKGAVQSKKSATKPKTGKKKTAARKPSSGASATQRKKTAPGEAQTKKKAQPSSGKKTAAKAPRPKAVTRQQKAKKAEPEQAPKEKVKKETGPGEGVKRPAPDLTLRGEFPWEHPTHEEPRVPCPACREPVYPDSTVCIYCGAMYMQCPHCRESAAALYNPKMATEQRLNRIFKQYTLFSIALPSMPMQDIMDCSNCKKHLILCESCRRPLKVNEEKCPECGHPVRKTKLLMNPLAVFEALFRKPDLSKSVQRAVEDLLRSMSEW